MSNQFGKVVADAIDVGDFLKGIDAETGRDKIFPVSLVEALFALDTRETHALVLTVGDETTALTVADGKKIFRMPYAFTLTGIRASVTTAPTDADIIVDVTEGGTTILSPLLTIEADEKTSTTAATPAVISDASLADDAEISINIDQIGSTIAGAGLKVYLIGYRT